MKNPLVIIPARGGSKGLPNKNIKILNGKPLINYTIEAARKVFEDYQICISTDSKKIKSIVEKTGLSVPFLRPLKLADDNSSQREVILHAIEYYENERNFKIDYIVLLQPTSPLRTSKDILNAIKLYNESLDMIVSVKETKSNPYFVLTEEDDKKFLKKLKESNFVTRQSCPKVWEFNGAIYIINKKSILKNEIHDFSRVKKYVMDNYSSIDIDNILDFKIAEYILKSIK
jgi:CMP-N,N'-diacetyllegionaminic acid synthase